MNINLSSNPANLGVRRQKFSIGSLLVMLLFGGAFLGAGIFALNSLRPDPNWTIVTGDVVEASSSTSSGSTSYTPVVRYVVNGQPYRVAGNISSSGYPNIGEKQEVAYSPDRPDQSKVIENIGSRWFLYLFPAVGIMCLLLAPYLFMRSVRRDNHVKKLMQNGQKLQGVLVNVHSSGSGSGSSYRIEVSAVDPSGTVQNYLSDHLTGIGGLAMMDFRNTPIPIDVFVDPLDTRNYYVDVADIPNLTPERIMELLKSAVMKKPVNTFANSESDSANNFTKPPETEL